MSDDRSITASSELRAIARRAAARAIRVGAGESAAGPASVAQPVSGATNRKTFGRDVSAHAQGFDIASKDVEPELVGESLVRAAVSGTELVIPPGARITPLARELAFTKGVTFVTGRSAEPLGPAVGRGSRGASRIAVASDHGGFALKDELLPLLREMGERPYDLGPNSAGTSVDYPDFAERVALEVSSGRAHFGIVVDGAGIGSAMVANKVPGVLAANCWNAASARNAREHNHANVLTLGSGHLDLAAARDVIAAFLATAPGEGRHARRNDKTLAVEARNLRNRQLMREFDEGR